MTQIKWMWECLQGKKKLYICAMTLTVLASIALIIIPTLGRTLVDRVIVGTTNPDGSVTREVNLLLPLLLGMVGAAVGRNCLRYGMILLYENTSQGMIVKLRSRLYNNLCALDGRFYDQMRTGDLMTRLTGDLDMIRHTAAWIVYNIIESALVFVIAIVYFFTMNVTMTLSMLALTPFLFVATYFFSKSVRPLYAALREKLAAMNSTAQENIAANRVVRAFAREDYEIERFSEKNEDYRIANITAQRQWLKFFPIIESMAQLMNVIVLFVGGSLIIAGKLTMGELLAFTTMTWCVANPMRNLGMLLNDIQRFFVAAGKVMEIYYARPAILDPDQPYIAETVRGGVVFKQVSFRYSSGTQALSDIDLTIAPGQTIAIMGPTGAGKTTLINLIARLSDVTDGAVEIDGLDVRQWQLHSLRSHIGVATQEVLLFSDTVDSNIAFGTPDLPEQEVRLRADMAAADFIDRLPNGYSTIIGERGTGLSGGQKQRIALARALAIKPAILILDDTTSAVDLETERYIQERLEELDFACTKIIIAQRISSVRNADQIIILENGRITQRGTHQELVEQPGYYKDIYQLQQGEM